MIDQAFHKNLGIIHDVAEDCDSGAWLFGGLLIGLHRNGGEIPWDSDVDMAVFRHRAARLLEDGIPKLIDAGFLFSGAWINNEGEVTEVTLLRDGKKFDFFLVDQIDDRFQWHYYWRDVQCVRGCPAHGFTGVTFASRRWRIPSEADAHLTFLYGNWRVPQRRYHYMKNTRGVVSRVNWQGRFEQDLSVILELLPRTQGAQTRSSDRDGGCRGN